MNTNKPMTAEELRVILDNHQRWLGNGCKGKGKANLREANLHEANLREANLQYANLREANLHEANLSGAGLRYADLQGANLGVTSKLAKSLKIIDACNEACLWVDSQNAETIEEIFDKARPEWQKWLTERMGETPTTKGLNSVINAIRLKF